jgi:hypothetical protein
MKREHDHGESNHSGNADRKLRNLDDRSQDALIGAPRACIGHYARILILASVQCEVLSSESVTRRSDHNPVVAWIQQSATT